MHRDLVLVFVLFGLAGPPVARAAPIMATVRGFDGRRQVHDTAELTFGRVELGFGPRAGFSDRGYGLLVDSSGTYQPPPGAVIPVPYRPGEMAGPPRARIDERIDSEFSLRLTFHEPGSAVAGDGPTVVFTGRAGGSFSASWDSRRVSGWYGGKADRVELVGWTPESDVPRWLIDGFLIDPSRVRISGAVTGGARNEYDSRLTIEPLASPVPEPTSLAAWGLVGLVALAAGRRRRRQAEATARVTSAGSR